MAVNIENIPDELRQRKQWVVWKTDKQPVFINGKPAKSNDPTTWLTFNQAVQMSHGYAGIGFVISQDDEFFGIDLDNCYDPQTGDVSTWAQPFLAMGTYAEISPSNHGLKIIGIGEPSINTTHKKSYTKGLSKKNPGLDKAPEILLVRSGLYFTVTGDVFNNHFQIVDCQSQLDELVPQLEPPREKRVAHQSIVANNEDRANLISRARSYVAKMAPAIQGQHGDQQTFTVACRLVRSFGLTQDEAWPVLCDYNERCEPPWAEKDLRHKLSCADEYDGQRGDLAGGRRLASMTSQKVSSTSRHESSSESAIRNFELYVDEKGHLKRCPRTMEDIRSSAKQQTGDWPRQTASTLFVHEAENIDFLEKPSSLFGYFQTKIGCVEWLGGFGFVSRMEYFEETKRLAKRYDAVERFPHIPEIAGHYYACDEHLPGDGSHLKQLLDMFCPAEPIDRDLILAAMLTLLWGGRGGSRPCFVITATGRGCGKSTLVELIALVFGGYIDFTNGEDFGQVKQRLLSNEALTKRVCLLDNVKSFRLSWAELEGLITAQTISGKKMYIGEAQRPNTLSWFVTLNGAYLSKDLAQRCVLIRLERPAYTGNWKDDAVRFIENYRREIISDLVGVLNRPPATLEKFSRWGDWEREILARLPDPANAQAVILQRQAEVDTDAEESQMFMDALKEKLVSLTYREDDVVFIPSAILCDIYNEAIRESKPSRSTTRMVKQWIEEGEVTGLCETGRSHGRGFIYVPDGQKREDVRYDIQERIARRVGR